MKRSIVACASFAVAIASAVPASAVTVSVNGTPSPSSGEFSAVPGVTTVDFDGASPAGWSITGDHNIVSGSLAGQYAAPPNSGPNANTSQYLAVPYGQSAGTAQISLGGLYNYYGLYWGSIDDYNTLSFWNDDVLVFTFTGSQAAARVPTAPDGEQSLAAYFNFSGLGAFNTVRLSSTQYAFETDNHAFGNVPVPATTGLLALGGLGLALARRRARRADRS
ncbi:MAG TPA: PEP-CTERM sorting domain-containing protein [Zeimonas sp.]